MLLIKDINRINQYAVDRQEVESEVVDKLGDYLFEQFQWTYKAIALGLFQNFFQAHQDHDFQFERFLLKETPYAMWKHSISTPKWSMEGLFDVYAHINRTYDKSILYDLSDFIRLAGEWIEKSHAQGLKFMEGGFEGKERLKPKPTFQKTQTCPICKSIKIKRVREGSRITTFKCLDPRHEAALKKIESEAKASRDAKKIQNAKRLRELNDLFSIDSPLPGHRARIARENAAPDPRLDQLCWNIIREDVKLRGLERWQLTSDSVMGAIDATFGLPPGGDVSGTTTDSMWILNSIYESVGGAPTNSTLWALQLVALATLVHGGHHTIVECAYPLTRHKVIDYKIGFYSTLTSAVAKSGSMSEHRMNQISNKLRAYDHEAPHVMTWREREYFHLEHTLALEFSGSEAEQLKESKFFNVLNAYSMCAVGRFPSTRQAYNMLSLYHPNLALQFVRLLLEDEEEEFRAIGRDIDQQFDLRVA